MTKTLIDKLAIVAISALFAFGAAMTAFAYDNLEIDIDIDGDTATVMVEYDDEEGEEVEEEYEYDETDLDDLYQLIADELDITVEEVEDAIDDINTDEEDGMEDAEEAISDAEEAISDLEDYIDGLDASSTPTTTIEELEADLAEAQGLLEDAEEAFEAEDYEEAKDLAEDAEDIVEAILGDDDDDDEEEEEEDDDDFDSNKFCDNTKKAAGWGVAKKCVNNDNWEINDKLASKVERFANFGKSNDKAVLQSQLQELLLVLIDLLQQQLAAKSGS